MRMSGNATVRERRCYALCSRWVSTGTIRSDDSDSLIQLFTAFSARRPPISAHGLLASDFRAWPRGVHLTAGVAMDPEDIGPTLLR